MRACSSCNSGKIKQASSILSRLLISAYIFLTFLFFIGRINSDALFALFPLILPNVYVCLDCNNIFLRILPKWSKDGILNVTGLDKYLFAILPSIILITLLITFFPYTGLGRIVYLPFIFLLNSAIIVISLLGTRQLNRCGFISGGVMLTLLFTIVLYPQEYNPHVLKQIWVAVFGL